jgi:predicted NBD/HSP70 family sugar kinase
MLKEHAIREVFLPNYRLDKKVNKYLVLESIRKRGPISVPEIAKLTRLSRPTIDNYIKIFFEKGVIKKQGVGDPQGGRKPNLWKLNNHAGYLIGMDIESPSLNLLLTDLDLNTIQSRSTSFSLSSKKEQVVEMLCQEIRELLISGDIDPAKVLGIGIGVPGIINKYQGAAISIERINDWHDVPLESVVTENVHIPVFIENDVMLMALAEKTFNRELKNEHNLIYLGFRYPSGLAARFFLDGRPYNGCFGNAGFVGHIQVEAEGPDCTCGKRGCLELYASVRSILDSVQNAIKRGEKTRINSLMKRGEEVSLHDVGRASEEGDNLSLQVLRGAAGYLAMGIEYLVSLYDIPLVVLGGSITGAGHVFLQLVREASRERLLSQFRKSLDIRYGCMGDDAASLGGALLVYNDIFKEPVLI